MNHNIIDLTGNQQPASPRSPAGGLKGPPVSGVEFLDVQQRLLRGTPANEQQERLQVWLTVGWTLALGGWATVGLMLWLASR